jgi:site-specific recombinase XerD
MAARSERTIDTYFEALEQLTALLHERVRGLAEATTADIQDCLIDVIERRRPSTANNCFRVLHRFYAWLEDEEEIPTHAAPQAALSPRSPYPSPTTTPSAGCSRTAKAAASRNGATRPSCTSSWTPARV